MGVSDQLAIEKKAETLNHQLVPERNSESLSFPFRRVYKNEKLNKINA